MVRNDIFEEKIALMENCVDLWIKMKSSQIANSDLMESKEKLLRFFTAVTLVTSIITAMLSASNLTQLYNAMPKELHKQDERQIVHSTSVENGEVSRVNINEIAGTRNFLVYLLWMVTTLVAVVTSASKICEKFVAKPQDIQRYRNVCSKLDTLLLDLTRFASRVVSMGDRVIGFDIGQLVIEFGDIKQRESDTTQLTDVNPTATHKNRAREEYETKSIARFWKTVSGKQDESTASEEIPVDSPGMIRAVRRRKA